jgi:hypothetical protein
VPEGGATRASDSGGGRRDECSALPAVARRDESTDFDPRSTVISAMIRLVPLGSSLARAGQEGVLYPPSGPQPPQGYGGAPYRPEVEFAFSDFERSVIVELAANVRFFGIVGIIFGGIGSLGGVLSLLGDARNVGQFVSIAGLLAQGIFASNAAQRFKMVSESVAGNIPNTLEALRALQRFYVSMIVVAVITTLTGLGTTLASVF